MRYLRFLLVPVVLLAASPLAGAEDGDPAAVPSPEALAKAETLVKETFGKEMESTRAADQRRLAGQLLELLDKAEVDLPMHYVLLTRAAEASAAGGDLETALDALNRFREAFALEVARWDQGLRSRRFPPAPTAEQQRRHRGPDRGVLSQALPSPFWYRPL